MKKIYIVLLAIALIFIVGCSQQEVKPEQQAQTIQNAGGPDFAPQPSESSAVNIEINDFAFNPSTITLRRGTTVTWTNQDSAPHTVTSDSGDELNSDTLSEGQSYSHTFNQAGIFGYYCSIHPRMKATIVIE